MSKIDLKYILIVSAIVVALFFIFTLLQQNDPAHFFTRQWGNIQQCIAEFFKAQKNNLFMEMAPKRSRPITLIEQETNLRLFAPQLFSRFEDAEWQRFWSIIYQPINDKKSRFATKRYRNREEMESQLIAHYPDPFEYLKQDQWKSFWTEVLKVQWEAQEGETSSVE